MMRMHAIDVPTTQLDVDKELGLTLTESASPALQDVEVISPAENNNDTREEN
jgi:hypothetical protein